MLTFGFFKHIYFLFYNIFFLILKLSFISKDIYCILEPKILFSRLLIILTLSQLSLLTPPDLMIVRTHLLGPRAAMETSTNRTKTWEKVSFTNLVQFLEYRKDSERFHKYVIGYY